MDQTTINLIGGAIMTAFGWFARTLYDKQEAHSKELSDFKIEVAKDYVPNDTLARVMDEVRGDLRYIRGRIDENPPQRRQGDHA